MTSPERTFGALAAILGQRGWLRNVVPASGGGDDSPITGVEHDSRRVRQGDLFVAIPGTRADGHDFVPRAVAAGAGAVLVERPQPSLAVPQLVVSAARPAMATAAAWRLGFPSHHLGVVGVTGTDGKTTTAAMVRSILAAEEIPTGVVGTVETIAGGQVLAEGRATTPESPELQAALAAMVEGGDWFSVVESTSHGLAQHRVDEVAYDVAVITNLTHEHLEFHRTHEAYRAAKRRLFELLAVGPTNPDKGLPKCGVVNLDDRWAGDFMAATRDVGARLLTYGADAGADVRLLDLADDRGGLRLGVATGRWSGRVLVPVAGRFNAANALAAIAVGEALGLDSTAIRAGLAGFSGVPGRMEAIVSDAPFTLIVDYAHTPRAIEVVLDDRAPRAAGAGGGLIAVFGSAGERDVAKRRTMGRIAGERCRLVVVTDEDPRGEDRMAILDEIAAGAEEAGRVRGRDLLVVPDRAAAISAAVERAQPGDVVVLAGKGHERTIETADGPIPWDERREAIAALSAHGWRT